MSDYATLSKMIYDDISVVKEDSFIETAKSLDEGVLNGLVAMYHWHKGIYNRFSELSQYMVCLLCRMKNVEPYFTPIYEVYGRYLPTPVCKNCYEAGALSFSEVDINTIKEINRIVRIQDTDDAIIQVKKLFGECYG